MNFAPFAFLAPLIAAEMRTTFQWQRIHAPEDWLLPGAVMALIAAYVWRLYRRDTADVRPSLAILLLSLRVLAWVGLFLVWLQPGWRNEEDVVTPSRVVVLVDTSLSMTESAGETADGTPTPDAAARATRSAEALRLLESPLVAELRKTHELHIAGFDGPQLRRAAVLDRTADKREGEAPAEPQTKETPLSEILAPRGAETRLGEALSQAIYDHRSAPVSGIVLLTDGGQNTGIEPLDALERARKDRVAVPPLLAVGLGSDRPVRNVRIQDVVAPPRTYPSDQFNVTAYVQAQGMAGRSIGVELTWRETRPGGEVDPNATPLARETKTLVLPEDGKPAAVEFTLEPEKVGRTTVSVTLANVPADDRNAADNALDADVEVTERRNRILLFASAATREYQFLRNQLQRLVRSDGTKDKEFVVDVFLQTGSDGVSQDSSEILPDFPDTAELMFDYDCVVAFDPDWRRLSPEQTALLRQWLEEKAGGMIVVAGRIYTDVLARDPNLAAIRALYPVEFGRTFAAAGDPIGGTADAWAMALSPAGKKADYLRLSDTDAAALDAWTDFEGFYDYYTVKSVKEKATVLAGLSDPRLKAGAAGSTIKDDARPYLMVEHSVGSGRVLYLADGEFWRLRKLNASYFTRLYTQLVRHVSQARLLRGSKRGVLLVDHDNGRYSLNEMVEVRAQLMDARARPYDGDSVEAQVLAPDRTQQTVRLARDPQLPGNYRGVFPVREIGAYRLDLQMPDGDRELLTRRLSVRVPNKESDDVRLNSALLERLASASGGAYFAGVDAALGRIQGVQPLVSRLADKTRVTPRLAKPVSLWDNEWTLGILCGLLCLEWLVRRLVRLA